MLAGLAWIILQAAGPIASALGQTGMNQATCFMGLILVATCFELPTS
jgi:small neutral amino acid transporter SnatA (MarC family)